MPFTTALSQEYQPTTPFGKFHITLDPTANRVNVTIRVGWDFQNVSTNPADLPWTNTTENAYKNAFRTNIPQTWNQKWKFRCTKPGYAGVFEPYFIIQDGTATNKHFDVLVGNKHDGSGLWADGRLQLYKYDNMAFDDIPNANKVAMNRTGVFDSEMQRLQAAVQNVVSVQMNRATNGTWSVAPADQVKLQQFALVLANLRHLASKVPITIHASSGAPGKANALVAEVMAELARNGANPNLYHLNTDPVATRRKFRWPGTPHKTSAQVGVTVDDDLMRGLGAWRYEYRVADHEFGHMLGLPDEYKIYDPTSRIGPAHQNWVALCTQANVQPNPFPADESKNLMNASLMSAGWVTCACHYVTIWAGLVRLTSGAPYNIAANQWVIERGTETLSL